MTLHACAICSKRLPADKMVFSSVSRRRFCRDITACEKRAKKRSRVSA